jgi:uncharacterized membrane protein YhhN
VSRDARTPLAVFGVVAVAHLASLAAGVTWLEWVTKALLIPSLAVWFARQGGPRLVLSALILCAAGDIALQFDPLFIAGMGLFAAAHVCYATYFLRSGAAAGLRRRWYIPLAYGLAWLTLVALLWSGLGGLRIPVALYAVLLTGTAVTSAGFSPWTGAGGLLFFVSDGLISLRLADLPQPPGIELWIMSTYIVAQYLLASGVLRHQTRAPAPALASSAAVH